MREPLPPPLPDPAKQTQAALVRKYKFSVLFPEPNWKDFALRHKISSVVLVFLLKKNTYAFVHKII